METAAREVQDDAVQATQAVMAAYQSEVAAARAADDACRQEVRLLGCACGVARLGSIRNEHSPILLGSQPCVPGSEPVPIPATPPCPAQADRLQAAFNEACHASKAAVERREALRGQCWSQHQRITGLRQQIDQVRQAGRNKLAQFGGRPMMELVQVGRAAGRCFWRFATSAAAVGWCVFASAAAASVLSLCAACLILWQPAPLRRR